MVCGGMKGLWNVTCDVQPEGSMRGKATRTGKAHAGETEIEGPISADMGTHETRTGHKSTKNTAKRHGGGRRRWPARGRLRSEATMIDLLRVLFLLISLHPR